MSPERPTRARRGFAYRAVMVKAQSKTPGGRLAACANACAWGLAACNARVRACAAAARTATRRRGLGEQSEHLYRTCCEPHANAYSLRSFLSVVRKACLWEKYSFLATHTKRQREYYDSTTSSNTRKARGLTAQSLGFNAVVLRLMHRVTIIVYM
jgi:hypothetical protein